MFSPKNLADKNKVPMSEAFKAKQRNIHYLISFKTLKVKCIFEAVSFHNCFLTCVFFPELSLLNLIQLSFWQYRLSSFQSTEGKWKWEVDVGNTKLWNEKIQQPLSPQVSTEAVSGGGEVLYSNPHLSEQALLLISTILGWETPTPNIISMKKLISPSTATNLTPTNCNMYCYLMCHKNKNKKECKLKLKNW